MVQIWHVIVCVRAAGSASGAGQNLYLGVEDGTCTWVQRRMEPGPWVQRMGLIPGCRGQELSLGERRTGPGPWVRGRDRSLGKRRTGTGSWVWRTGPIPG